MDFGELAEDYDRLRPVDNNWRDLFELLLVEGELAGNRVLDVGCGTGAFAVALAERGAQVWGIDPSREMLAQAKAKARSAGGRSVGFKLGRAEALPFKDGWFDRVVLRLVVHLVDRPKALQEAARVLIPAGRIVIATFSPEHFGSYWLNTLFPDILRIDRNRFPTPAALTGELEDAGFSALRIRTLQQRGRLRREEALERIRGRFISTLRLLDEAAYAAGLEQAERELPDVLELTTEWAVLVADRR